MPFHYNSPILNLLGGAGLDEEGLPLNLENLVMRNPQAAPRPAPAQEPQDFLQLFAEGVATQPGPGIPLGAKQSALIGALKGLATGFALPGVAQRQEKERAQKKRESESQLASEEQARKASQARLDASSAETQRLTSPASSQLASAVKDLTGVDVSGLSPQELAIVQSLAPRGKRNQDSRGKLIDRIGKLTFELQSPAMQSLHRKLIEAEAADLGVTLPADFGGAGPSPAQEAQQAIDDQQRGKFETPDAGKDPLGALGRTLLKDTAAKAAAGKLPQQQAQPNPGIIRALLQLLRGNQSRRPANAGGPPAFG